jgi:hypothetical protein
VIGSERRSTSTCWPERAELACGCKVCGSIPSVTLAVFPGKNVRGLLRLHVLDVGVQTVRVAAHVFSPPPVHVQTAGGIYHAGQFFFWANGQALRRKKCRTVAIKKKPPGVREALRFTIADLLIRTQLNQTGPEVLDRTHHRLDVFVIHNHISG